jgi:alpha-tubulin suppressor-like RCC1 family protein
VVSNLTGVSNISMDSMAFSVCVTLNDSTAKCWGRNYYNNLSDQTTTTRLSPVTVQSNDGSNNYSTLTNLTSVASNIYTTCFLHTDKTITCSGDTLYGGAGDNQTTTDYTTSWATKPVGTGGTVINNATKITGNNNYTCVLIDNGTAGNTTDDTIKCWGYDGYYNMGQGSILAARKLPVTVLTAAATPLTGVTDVSAGIFHACAIVTGGNVYCWGKNTYGGLAEDPASVTQRTYATLIPGVTNAQSVYAGYYNTCVIKTDGSVSCFGINTNGQLGNGTTTSQYVPVDNIGGFSTAGGNGAVKIGQSYQSVCIVLSTGSIYCSGSNSVGQLGQTVLNATVSTPTIVPGISTATDVKMGYFATCALLSDQTVSCWGEDTAGTTGQGLDDHSVPFTLSNFP